jgi:hypothetical protein
VVLGEVGTLPRFSGLYESPSQFSREYRRFFGEPPLRDITSFRQMADRAGVYGAIQFN